MLTDKGTNSAKSWPKPVPQQNHLWDLGDRNALEGMKEKKSRYPKQKPRTPAHSNLSNASLTKIHKPRIFHNKHFALEEPGSDSQQSPLLLQTHAIFIQQCTEQAHSAYSEPQGLKFCLWEIRELSWERDMATGSFLLLENVTGSSPSALSYVDSWPPVWSSPRPCQNRWYLELQKQCMSHPLKPSPAVWGPACRVCDLWCINCRLLFIRNSIW